MEFIDWCKQYKNDLCLYYEKKMGKKCNIDNPETFTEKIQWLKIYDSNFLKTYCTDKILLHEYCKNKLGEDICIPIINTYNSFDEIDFNKLPQSFVIKCNHGCGCNIIVKDKNNININDTKYKVNKWMNKDYSFNYGYELHYHLINRKIFVEQYMHNEGKEDLTDYKVYCFNGQPQFFQIINDRSNLNKHLNHYDLNWNYLKWLEWKDFKSCPNEIDKKPELLNKLINLAKIFSEDFILARPDFYIINNKIYLGEITFTPNSGFHKFVDKNTDIKLGRLLKLF